MVDTIRNLVIVGAGGFAREVAWLAEQVACRGTPLRVVAFADDAAERLGTNIRGIPVVPLEDSKRLGSDAFVVAVGSPAVRERLADRSTRLGLDPLTLVHPNVEMSTSVKLGAGTVVCAGCILTVDIEIGEHAQLNLDCTVGHDTILEDFATLAPGVHVSGNVRLARGAYVGTGANIINGSAGHPLEIGRSAVVGAGACVTASVPPGNTVVGVPARPIAKR